MRSHRQTHVGLSRAATAATYSWHTVELRWEVLDSPSLFFLPSPVVQVIKCAQKLLRMTTLTPPSLPPKFHFLQGC